MYFYKRVMSVTVLLSILLACGWSTAHVAKLKRSELSCEAITIPLCANMSYNQTIMPNHLNHQNQATAANEMKKIDWFLKSNCDANLGLFVCAIYTPKCGSDLKAIPLCRSFCQSVIEKEECKKLYKFTYHWNTNGLDCSKFPEDDGTVECIKPPVGSNVLFSPVSVPGNEKIKEKEKVPQ